jgi:uncharacterized spore protein YtfJ
MNIGDPIKTTVEELRKILNIDNVIGKPVETNELLMIPFTKMGLAFGAGMGEAKGLDDLGNGSGAGSGGGAGIEPTAMVIVYKGIKGPEGVKVVSLISPGALTNAIGEISHAAMDVIEKGSEAVKKEKK